MAFVPSVDLQAPSQLLTRRTVLTLAAAATFTTRFGRATAAQEATPTTRSATVQVNGTELYYEQSGSGPALLLLPGLAANGKYWGSLLPALQPHFRCMPHFGPSLFPGVRRVLSGPIITLPDPSGTR